MNLLKRAIVQISSIGRSFYVLISYIGSMAIFGLHAVSNIVPPIYLKQFFQQLFEVGYKSLPLIGLISFFSGTTLALQVYVGNARIGAGEAFIAQVVLVGITREIAPVIGGFVVAGRTGTTMTAEIGSMATSYQIEALRSLGVNPIKYIAVPRILASTISFPILILVADVMGVWGGYLVSYLKLGMNPSMYLENTWDFLTFKDVYIGLIKAGCFGFISSIIACYQGFNCGVGSKGVAMSVATTVVSSSIFILVLNYFITQFFTTT